MDVEISAAIQRVLSVHDGNLEVALLLSTKVLVSARQEEFRDCPVPFQQAKAAVERVGPFTLLHLSPFELVTSEESHAVHVLIL